MQSGDFRRRGDIQKEVAATSRRHLRGDYAPLVAATRFSSGGDMQAVTSGDPEKAMRRLKLALRRLRQSDAATGGDRP